MTREPAAPLEIASRNSGAGEGHGLAEAHRRAGNRDLVGDLAALAVARRAHVCRPPEVREDRGEPGGRVAAGEDWIFFSSTVIRRVLWPLEDHCSTAVL
jgi:hypothetical protein